MRELEGNPEDSVRSSPTARAARDDQTQNKTSTFESPTNEAIAKRGREGAPSPAPAPTSSTQSVPKGSTYREPSASKGFGKKGSLSLTAGRRASVAEETPSGAPTPTAGAKSSHFDSTGTGSASGAPSGTASAL